MKQHVSIFIPVSSGTTYRNLSSTAIVIVKNKVEHFHSLHRTEVNFHEVRCLTVMTSSSR